MKTEVFEYDNHFFIKLVAVTKKDAALLVRMERNHAKKEARYIGTSVFRNCEVMGYVRMMKKKNARSNVN